VWQTATVSQLKAEMRKTGALSKSHGMFYNGFKTIQEGYFAAKELGKEVGGITYDKAVPDDFYRKWASPGRETPEQQQVRINAMSAAFAQASTGTVYVVVPKGVALRDPSTWAQYELPNLTRTPYVHEIIRIDFEPGKKFAQLKKTSLWKGPRGPVQGVWPPRVPAQYSAIFT